MQEPLNTFEAGGQFAPIRVAYHGRSHYNAIVDPANPTFGEGLGFAGLRTGGPDQAQLEDALRQSEQERIEQELLEQTLRVSGGVELEDEIIAKSIAASEQESLQRAMEASALQASVASEAAGASTGDGIAAVYLDDDDEIARAIALSLAGEQGTDPPAGR